MAPETAVHRWNTDFETIFVPYDTFHIKNSFKISSTSAEPITLDWFGIERLRMKIEK
jgi:hypothetical protein